MTQPQPNEVRVAAPDIGDIWTWTVDRFGHAAALRYETLIDQAVADLAENPARPAAKERPDLQPGPWLYHLAFSRDQVPGDHAVKAPRHFVMFRHLQPGIIEIVRILHNSRDLALHLPEGYQAQKFPKYAFSAHLQICGHVLVSLQLRRGIGDQRVGCCVCKPA